LLPWKKLGYYKVSQQEFGFRIYSSRDYKKENQVVGYGKQKMIFSPSTGLTNKWVVLKPYLISFQVLELGNVLDYHSFIINYA
jgi:hypothetical protein